MHPIRRVWPSAQGLLFEVDTPGDRVFNVLVEGRRIWSFREPEGAAPAGPVPDGHGGGPLRFEPWPPIIVPRLAGRFRVALQVQGAEGTTEADVVLGDGAGAPRLADVHGRPLVVNKWGRLGHTIADAEPGLVERMLDHMDDIRDLLQEKLGPVVFVAYGTLLGPVRDEGKLIPHDDDADLAYLSRWSHPADVAREHFELGRLLCEQGYEVLRQSAAHVQMHFSHNGVPDHYVDVFAGFLLDGWWYQHFAIRAQLAPEALLPTGTILVEGRPEPAPAQPEVVLGETFGPSWRVPDPAFTYHPPASVTGRLKSWFGDVHVDRETWEDLVLLDPTPAPQEQPPSAYADWVDRHTPAQHRILELGCGRGGDAAALAARGRAVRAIDFSRMAVQVAQARPVDPSARLSFEVLNVFDLRRVLRLGAECAAEEEPWTVFGRRFLNAIDSRGRSNVFRLCAMLLRRGGAAHFDLVTDRDYTGIQEYLRLTMEEVVQEFGDHGLVLEEATRHIEPMTWIGAPDEELVELTRMTVRRRPR